MVDEFSDGSMEAEKDTGIDDALAHRPVAESSRARALDDAAASAVAAVHRSTVVVLAGEVGSGKTTLLAALYERFGRGEVASRRFAGSATLPGFEARCWGLREGSGRETPAMPHTNRFALPWLHLRLADEVHDQDLLLGDFDGEIFGDVIDGRVAPSQVPALRRADHVVIVLDGDALVDPARRQSVEQRSHDLIAAFAGDADAIADPSVLAIAVSKQDAVDGADPGAQQTAELIVANVRSALISAFPGHTPAVVTTAAVPRTGALPLGHGLDELVDMWARAPALKVLSEHRPMFVPADSNWLARFTS